MDSGPYPINGRKILNLSVLPSGNFIGSWNPTNLTVPSQIYWRTRALLLSEFNRFPNRPIAGDFFKASKGPLLRLNNTKKIAPTIANPTTEKVNQRFRQYIDNSNNMR